MSGYYAKYKATEMQLQRRKLVLHWNVFGLATDCSNMVKPLGFLLNSVSLSKLCKPSPWVVHFLNSKTFCFFFLNPTAQNSLVWCIHSSVICHMTGPQPLPKRFLHLMRSRASSFKWEYSLLSPRSSSNCWLYIHIYIYLSVCVCIPSPHSSTVLVGLGPLKLRFY
jgi:hypothetical protein